MTTDLMCVVTILRPWAFSSVNHPQIRMTHKKFWDLTTDQSFERFPYDAVQSFERTAEGGFLSTEGRR